MTVVNGVESAAHDPQPESRRGVRVLTGAGFVLHNRRFYVCGSDAGYTPHTGNSRETTVASCWADRHSCIAITSAYTLAAESPDPH